MEIFFNTSNEKKYTELESLFPFPIHRCNFDVNEIQGSPIEISNSKAISISKIKTDAYILADDVSLEIDGLNGFPGPYVKYFLKIGHEKIEKIASIFGRTAIARCILSLAHNGQLLYTAEGSIKGTIVKKKEFGKNFGFDAIFKPDNFEITFAEMTLEQKNEISHRGIAARNLVKYLKTHSILE